jgi:hypothetical protein
MGGIGCPAAGTVVARRWTLAAGPFVSALDAFAHKRLALWARSADICRVQPTVFFVGAGVRP